MVKITSAYALGYAWSEVGEEDDGSFTVLSGGKQSGVGIYPRAFEHNAGTADFTNAIVQLNLSSDKDTGAVTASFDGKSTRVAANDKPALSANPTYAAGTLTIPYNIFEFDIKGRNTSVTSANRTVAIPAGGGTFDAYQEAVLVEAAVTKVTIPTDNGASTILEFVDDTNPGQIKLRTKSGTQYKGVFYDGSNNAIQDYARFH